MELINYLAICLIQGLTEIIPISSSGHIILINSHLSSIFLSIDQIIILHFCTALVIIFTYRQDISLIIKSLITSVDIFPNSINKKVISSYQISHRSSKKGLHLLLMILVSSLSTFIIYMLLKRIIESTVSNIPFVGLLFSINGLILIFLSNYSCSEKDISDLSIFKAFCIGLFQALGVFPGISRLGITVLGSILSGINWKDSITYSLLLSIPTMIGAPLIEKIKKTSIFINTFNNDGLVMSLGGLFLVVASSLISIKLLQGKLSQKSFLYFGIWCLLLGTLVLIGII